MLKVDNGYGNIQEPLNKYTAITNVVGSGLLNLLMNYWKGHTCTWSSQFFLSFLVLKISFFQI